MEINLFLCWNSPDHKRSCSRLNLNKYCNCSPLIFPAVWNAWLPCLPSCALRPKLNRTLPSLLKNQLEIRLRNISTVAQRLAAQEALREDLNVKQAADIIWAITSPEVFSLLTVDRGWTRERYARWLSDTLIRLLLP